MDGKCQLVYSAISSHHSSNILEKLYAQFKEGQNCDLEIKIHEGILFAHKCVVEIFITAGVQLENDRYVLNLSEISDTIVTPLLDMIYTGELRINPLLIHDVQNAASILGFTEAVKGCNMYLSNCSGKIDDEIDLTALAEGATKVKVSPVATCHICSYSTKKRYNLKRHMKLHVNREPPISEAERIYRHLCVECGKRYKSRVGMLHHVKKVHQQSFLYHCAICYKGYNGIANYRGHLASHDPSLCEKCPTCDKTFRFKKSLILHKQRCGKPRVANVPCTKCDEKFTSKDGLRQHEKVKHENVSYSCKKCLKTFKWRSSLAYHMKNCKGQSIESID